MVTCVLFLSSLVIFKNLINADEQINLTINTSNGLVKGAWKKSISGRDFAAFTGIPYALPPTGELRFKEPLFYPKWNATLDATKESNLCPQIFEILGLKNDNLINEDCLYLNVYTPTISEKNLPVIVFIHGGGFSSGGNIPHTYGPDFILDKNIILVVPNYRIGFLGFGSTEDNEFPGNLGLKDQLLALKWVKENIKAYGGNPNKVTLFGHSAGAACVHYHMMSPLSQVYFQRAILSSGSGFNSWAISAPGKVANFTRALGKKLRCPTSSSKSLMSCLSKLPTAAFIRPPNDFSIWEGNDPFVIFTPVFEQKSERSFITKENYITPTKIPILTGITSNEGGFKMAMLYSRTNNITSLLTMLNKNFIEIGPVTLNINDKYENKEHIASKIKSYVFAEKEITMDSVSKLLNLYSDTYFVEGTRQFVRRHNGPIYLYKFAYKGSYTYGETLSYGNFNQGVIHGDDMQYIFPMKGMFPRKSPLNEEEMHVSKRLIDYFVNFAYFGHPNSQNNMVKWHRTSYNCLNYLLINKTDSVNFNFNSNYGTFWDRIGWLTSLLPSSRNEEYFQSEKF